MRVTVPSSPLYEDGEKRQIYRENEVAGIYLMHTEQKVYYRKKRFMNRLVIREAHGLSTSSVGERICTLMVLRKCLAVS